MSIASHHNWPRKLAILNGHVVDPANQVDRIENLYIEQGRILACGTAPQGFRADHEIDASGLLVCPGLIDLSARLREPGLEHKTNIASETRAAASQGITTLCCPPDTNPVIDTPAVARLIRQRAEQSGFARVIPLAALTQSLNNHQLSEMAALKAAGCPAVHNTTPITDTAILRNALLYAATQDMTVFLPPVDHWLSHEGVAHEGAVATRLGLPGIPAAAETAAVAREIALAEQTGARIHFARLSTAQAVRMVARARFDGIKVSADVAIAQLFFTEMDVEDYDATYHVSPPLRTQADRNGLRDGIAQGVITAICSDHQPHEADAKLAPFSATEPGMSSLELLLPLTLRLVDEGVLSLSDAIARLSCGPADVLGLDIGKLNAGQQADLCLIDPQAVWTFRHEQMLSRGLNAPCQNWEFSGRVCLTLVAGQPVYSDPERPFAGQP